MAFSERVKAAPGAVLQCAVCRQPIQEGRRIRNAAYQCSAPLCRDCFQKYYLNKQDGMDVGITDDTARIRVRYRPAEILERDPLFRKAPPPGGYEYPLPEIRIGQTIRDTVFWSAFCIGLMLLATLEHMKSGGASAQQSLSAAVLHVLLPVGSLVWAMRYLYQLIRGILYGIGHTRRLVLLGAAAVCLLLAWVCRMGMFIW